MTLNELRYIVALHRERHFSRAANACFVSQPTLSIAVKKLEDELGVQLFERGNNEIITTEVGELIIAEAEALLKKISAIKQIASASQDPLSGSLRLGIIYTIAPYLLPSLVREIMQLAPKMPLMLQENFTHRLLELVREGELDAAIIATPVESTFDAYPLYEENFLVVVPHTHPWANRQTIKSGELADENILLLGQGHCFRDHVLQACPNALTQHNDLTAFEGITLETIRHTVSSGYGISILPSTSRQKNEPQLRYIPLESDIHSRCVSVITRKGYPRQKAIKVLLEAAHNCAIPDVHYY